MAELMWRKSTRSREHECVEAAFLPESTLVRDSKNPEAGHVAVSAGQWRSFLAGVKSGRYDR